MISLTRWRAVWQRNALVWRKSARTALLGGIAEPLFYLFALGYGLGRMVGPVNGLSYAVFLCAGLLATSAMNTATIEGLYLAYTRMENLRTWDGMLAAPLGISDIVLGEIFWMASKSVISASLILSVASLAGLTHGWLSLGALPLAFLAGLCFGSMALVITAYANSYDFFVYYISLFVTPSVLLSGVFFPAHLLPSALQSLVAWLPLAHIVHAMRMLLNGHIEASFWIHIMVPLLCFFVAACWAGWRLQRRLLH